MGFWICNNNKKIKSQLKRECDRVSNWCKEAIDHINELCGIDFILLAERVDA
jgi:hypothetical protein